MTLATAVAGCVSQVFQLGSRRLDLIVGEPDGAAIVVTWEGVDRRDELSMGVAAKLKNRGAEPCPVAVYLHENEPVREDMPTLTGLPAPETAGELIFEGVLLPPRDGVVFSTEIGHWDDLFSSPDEFHDVPAEPPTTRRWLTIATCAAPDVEVAMELSLHHGRSAWPRRNTPAEMSADILWQ